MKVIVIPPTGPISVEDAAGLAEFQKLVGGYIELLALRLDGFPDVAAYINEESKGMGLPQNWRATTLARTAGIAADDYIAGPMLLFGMNGPEETDAPAGLLDELAVWGLR